MNVQLLSIFIFIIQTVFLSPNSFKPTKQVKREYNRDLNGELVWDSNGKQFVHQIVLYSSPVLNSELTDIHEMEISYICF